MPRETLLGIYNIKKQEAGRRGLRCRKDITTFEAIASGQPYDTPQRNTLLMVCKVPGTHRDRDFDEGTEVRDTQLATLEDLEGGAQHNLDFWSPRGGSGHGVKTRVGPTRMVDQGCQREDSLDITKTLYDLVRGDHVDVALDPIGVVRGGGDREHVEKINGGATANKPWPNYLLATQNRRRWEQRVATNQDGKLLILQAALSPILRAVAGWTKSRAAVCSSIEAVQNSLVEYRPFDPRRGTRCIRAPMRSSGAYLYCYTSVYVLRIRKKVSPANAEKHPAYLRYMVWTSSSETSISIASLKV